MTNPKGEGKIDYCFRFQNAKRVLILLFSNNVCRVVAYTPGDPIRSEREYHDISDASLLRLMDLPL
ncbi:MAG: hypothetical protein ABID84_03620 [Chloroflexota bacterium]